jgi:hypothetical protein
MGKLKDLDDDFFFDDDRSVSTGEIEASPVDASVAIQVKEVASQVNKMRSAVNKIFKAYNTAYSKESFKDKFDIYPMRDFDLHMADLGAKRSGKHFVPFAGKVDWVAKVKTYLDARNAKREEYQKKIDEEKAKELADNPKVIDPKVTNDADKIKGVILQYVKDNNIKVAPGLEDFLNKETTKLLLAKGDPNLQQFKGLGQYSWLATTGKENPNSNSDELHKLLNKITRESKPDDVNKQAQIFQLSNETKSIKTLQTEIETLRAEIKKQNSSSIPKDEQTDAKKQLEELEKKLKIAENKTKSLTKGVVVTVQQQRDMANAIGTEEERMFSAKYDGFTTAGPFCLQKRDYFLNVYLPSVDHTDTEFREPQPTVAKVKDIGNQVKEIIHKVGSSGAEDEVSPGLPIDMISGSPTGEKRSKKDFTNDPFAPVSPSIRADSYDPLGTYYAFKDELVYAINNVFNDLYPVGGYPNQFNSDGNAAIKSIYIQMLETLISVNVIRGQNTTAGTNALKIESFDNDHFRNLVGGIWQGTGVKAPIQGQMLKVMLLFKQFGRWIIGLKSPLILKHPLGENPMTLVKGDTLEKTGKILRTFTNGVYKL